MTAPQSAQYDSIVGIRQLFTANPEVTGFMPALSDTVAAYDSKVEKLNGYLPQQDADITGNTAAKTAARQAAIGKWMPLSAAAYAYAQINNNLDLAGELKTTVTELRDRSDDAFLARIERLIIAINSIDINALAPYNITKETILDATKDFNTWKGLMTSVRRASAASTAATEKIGAMLKEIMAFLAQRMDPLVTAIEPMYPDFAAQYQIVRELEDPATQTRALTVTVRQLIDGEMVPVAGVEALINPGGLAKTTAEEGQFYVQTLAPGTYTLTLSKPGYASPAPLAFTVADGEMTSLPVTLVKA